MALVLTETLKQLIARAAADPEFRRMLVNNSERALKEYPLTLQEIGILTQLTPEEFERLMANSRSSDS